MIDVANADLLLTTTRSVRRRLDLDRAVPPGLVDECLQIAMQAPTGGNLQGWHFVVVTDEATREAIAALYEDAWERYIASVPYEFPADDPRGQRFPFVVESAQHLADEIGLIPVAYHTGESFRPAQRRSLAATVSYERWGASAPV
jgi:nitroreductase